MIKIDFSFFICYYVISGFVLFAAAWLWERRSVARGSAFGKDQVWQCATCFYVYFESRWARISTCPLCGSLNQKTLKRGNEA